MTSTDPIKLGAARARLRNAGIETLLFDVAAGALWTAIIPVRLMVGDADLNGARRVLREAGFVEARDGDWDLST